MAEERIIDDEYGRGVKLRKTKDGFVDVTDELAEEKVGDEEAGEEISFAFPLLEGEEDDEDLVGLTPEEAIALRKQKAEAAERRKKEYDRTIAEGNALLDTHSYHAAELKFEKALDLDELATDASVGYWRAKTANFTNPDVLVDEYVEAGIQSLEYDLGFEATEIIKKEHHAAFQQRYAELKGEHDPLYAEVTGKQERRRAILKVRRKKSWVAFAAAAVPFLTFLILTIVFGLKNFTIPESTYIPATIVFAALSVASFIVLGVFTNKLINTLRIFTANEKLDSTEEGERLVEITERMELYEELLKVQIVEDAPQA